MLRAHWKQFAHHGHQVSMSSQCTDAIWGPAAPFGLWAQFERRMRQAASTNQELSFRHVTSSVTRSASWKNLKMVTWCKYFCSELLSIFLTCRGRGFEETVPVSVGRRRDTPWTACHTAHRAGATKLAMQASRPIYSIVSDWAPRVQTLGHDCWPVGGWLPGRRRATAAAVLVGLIGSMGLWCQTYLHWDNNKKIT